MGQVRYVNFHPDEWLVGTMGLSWAERGVYITACALMYSHGGPIEIDHLRRACHDHGRVFNFAIKRLLGLGKLVLDGTLLANRRALNEIEKASKRALNSRENGAKHKKINKVRNPAGVTKEPKKEEGVSLRSTPSLFDSSLRSLSSEIDKGFVEFYRVFPRHEDPGKAEKAWKAACKKAQPAAIIAGAVRYAEQRAGQDKQFTKLPASWLNAEAWKNEDVVGPLTDNVISAERLEAARLQVLAEMEKNPDALLV